MKRKGLLIVNTGNGKGKTTAALGLMFRAWGHNMRVGMLQFMKSSDTDYGEYRAAEKIGMEILQWGDNRTWNSLDIETTKELAIKFWGKAQERITSGRYDLLVLDEFSLVLHFGWVDTDQVVQWLKKNKPEKLHLVITGRDAPQALIEAADLVTEMKKIHHHYSDQGLDFQPGVDR